MCQKIYYLYIYELKRKTRQCNINWRKNISQSFPLIIIHFFFSPSQILHMTMILKTYYTHIVLMYWRRMPVCFNKFKVERNQPKIFYIIEVLLSIRDVFSIKKNKQTRLLTLYLFNHSNPIDLHPSQQKT